MRAGPLRYKLEVFKPVIVVSGYGSGDTRWESAGTIYAEIIKQSGNRSEEVGEHFADYQTEFRIRYAHDVRENWRVRHLGGDLYTVTAVIPAVDGGYKKLVCVRVNE